MEPIFIYNDQFPVYISKYVLQQPNERVVNVDYKPPKPFELKAPDESKRSKKDTKKDKEKEELKEKKERPFNL